MKRRKFLHSLGFVAGGLYLNKSLPLPSGKLNLEDELKTALDEDTFWRTVRKQFVFPEDYAYLNTGGIGAVPAVVMHQVRASSNGQQLKPRPGYDHDKWMEIKEKCTALISPEISKDELALVSTATEGINIIINGLPLKRGDEVITSTHEHAGLHVPLLNKVQQHGIKVKAFEPDMKRGLGNVERIEKLITNRTKLIFISHVTCTTGQCFPIKEIGELAKSRGIWFAVDGAQAAGTMVMDVLQSNVDFYAFSGHKWVLGPKRTGVLFVRKDLLDTVKPTVVGAYSDGGYDIRKGTFKLNPTAQRYEYATQNEALFHGLGKAVDFVITIGLNRIHNHNCTLAERFYHELQQIPEVEILSPEEKEYRSSIISFKVKGRDFRQLGKYLVDRDIRVRVVPEAGLNGVRISFHIYNNEKEIERLISQLKEYIKA